MIKRVKLTPIFDTKEIMNTTLQKDWFEFQNHALQTGKALLHYMQSFINANRKRSGGKGTLARAMDFYIIDTKAKVHWGIGHIPSLNQRAKGFGGRPYWYVVNYGKKATGEAFIPGGGRYRPYMFTDGPADPSKRGAGTSKATGFKRITGSNEPKPSVIRPMNYIEATYHQLLSHINALLARFKRS